MSHVANACSGSRAAAAPRLARCGASMRRFWLRQTLVNLDSRVVFRRVPKVLADGVSDSRIDRARTKRPADKNLSAGSTCGGKISPSSSCRW
jgi:hypothetical protein